MRIGPVFVVESWYVKGPKTPESYYLIEVKPTAPAWAPITRLVTRDGGLYSDCLGVEGLPIAVEVEFHRAGGANILDSVDLVEADA